MDRLPETVCLLSQSPPWFTRCRTALRPSPGGRDGLVRLKMEGCGGRGRSRNCSAVTGSWRVWGLGRPQGPRPVRGCGTHWCGGAGLLWQVRVVVLGDGSPLAWKRSLPFTTENHMLGPSSDFTSSVNVAAPKEEPDTNISFTSAGSLLFRPGPAHLPSQGSVAALHGWPDLHQERCAWPWGSLDLNGRPS